MHKAVSLHYLSYLSPSERKTADSRTILKGDKIELKLEIRLFLRLLSKKGTIDILKMLKDKNRAQYRDLSTIDIGIATLSDRINESLKNGIIEHHLKRTTKREEFYTLSEKGERILKLIEEIEEIIN
ncbi:MAG: hypothetical protein AYK18_17340 [Theionarchaea archaeon DG-70]|nr:MAG: hypothetical protein AYK18_17340 [Theionarchaea archaeon DG-70]